MKVTHLSYLIGQYATPGIGVYECALLVFQCAVFGYSFFVRGSSPVFYYFFPTEGENEKKLL